MADLDLDKLQVNIESNAGTATAGIDALAASLAKLGSSAGPSGTALNRVQKRLTDLNTALSGLNTRSLLQLSALGTALNKLNTVKVGKSLTTNLTSVVTSVNAIKSDDLAKIETMATNLTKLSTALEKLKGVGSAAGVIRNTMKGLNVELDSSGQKALKSSIGFKLMQDKLAGLNVTFMLAFNVMRRFMRIIVDCVDTSNQFIENMNLFTVAMGNSADEATAFAQKVQDIMGIDMSDWVRNQGVFQTLITGFGVVSERADIMSQQLTQLGYDLSSFFNLPVDEAMQKLQSGISGELEPLRRLGFDLSQAKLQSVALSLGIDQSIQSMTQAQKAQLRYYAIMTQVTAAQKDMSRTLESPANQLRILQSQLHLVARSLGNIFIPALTHTIPYLLVFLRAVRTVADAIAKLFGFEMPEFDYSGLTDIGNTFDDVEDALDNGAASAKKIKSYLLGIDELNVLEPPKDSGRGGDLTDIKADDWTFELPTYDFLGDAVNEQVDKLWAAIKPKVDWLAEHADMLLTIVKDIGIAILSFKVATGVVDFFNSLRGADLMSNLDKLKMMGGIVLTIAGLEIAHEVGADIAKEGLTLKNVVLSAISTVATAAGLGLTASALGAGPLGIGIAAGIGAFIALDTILFSYNQAKMEEEAEAARIALEEAIAAETSKRFGTVTLSSLEIEAEVMKVNTSDIAIKTVAFKNASELADKASQAFATQVTDTMNIVVKSGIGVEVTQVELLTSVDKLTETANKSLQATLDKGLSAINILPPDSVAGSAITNYLSGFYQANETQLNELGNQLRGIIAEGFVDGEWIPNKQQEALDIIAEMQEVERLMGEYEFNVEIAKINAEYENTILTEESFNELSTRLQEATQAQIDSLETQRVEALVLLEMSYKSESNTLTYAEYLAAQNEINDKFAQAEFEVQANASVTLNPTIEEGWGDLIQTALDISDPGRWAGYKKLDLSLSKDMLGENFIATTDLMHDRLVLLTDDYKAQSGAAEKLYQSTLNSNNMMAETAKLQLRSGNALDENTSAMLNNAYAIAMMANHSEGYYYSLGRAMTANEDFIDSLAETQTKITSQDFNLGFLANTVVAYEEATNQIHFINDELGDYAVEYTDILASNLTTMGFYVNKNHDTYENVLNRSNKVSRTFIANSQKVFQQQANEYTRYYTQLYEDSISGMSTASSKMADTVGDNNKRIADSFDNSIVRINNKLGAIPTYLGTTFTSNINNAVTKISGGLNNMINPGEITSKFDRVTSHLNTNTKTAFDNVTNTIKNMTSSLNNIGNVSIDFTISDAAKNVGSWIKTNVVDRIKADFDALTLKPRFQVPQYTVEADDQAFSSLGAAMKKSLAALGVSTMPKLTIRNWQYFATGGFPTEGSAFIAGEAGPELVGTIGGRSAVVAGDQIVEAVALGVAQGMMATQGQDGQPIQLNVKVDLDGNTVYYNQEQVSARKGYDTGMRGFNYDR